MALVCTGIAVQKVYPAGIHAAVIAGRHERFCKLCAAGVLIGPRVQEKLDHGAVLLCPRCALKFLENPRLVSLGGD